MEKTFKFLALVIFVWFSSTIISCSDPEEMTSICDEGTFTFKLNGEDWSGETFNNTIIFGTDPQSGTEALRCDIRATNSEGDKMILTFNNPGAVDDSCVELGTYTSIENVTSSNSNVFFFTYSRSGSILTFSSFEGILNITECDEDNNRQISGTFAFTDFFEENEGTEGVFTVCIPN